VKSIDASFETLKAKLEANRPGVKEQSESHVPDIKRRQKSMASETQEVSDGSVGKRHLCIITEGNR